MALPQEVANLTSWILCYILAMLYLWLKWMNFLVQTTQWGCLSEKMVYGT